MRNETRLVERGHPFLDDLIGMNGTTCAKVTLFANMIQTRN